MLTLKLKRKRKQKKKSGEKSKKMNYLINYLNIYVNKFFKKKTETLLKLGSLFLCCKVCCLLTRLYLTSIICHNKWPVTSLKELPFFNDYIHNGIRHYNCSVWREFVERINQKACF